MNAQPAFLLLFLCCFSAGNLSAQSALTDLEKRVDFTVGNATLAESLRYIREMTGITFSFKQSDADQLPRMSMDCKNVTVDSVLKRLLEGSIYQFLQSPTGGLLLMENPSHPLVINAPRRVPIMGVVIDEDGNPLPGVSVTLMPGRMEIETNEEGEFRFFAAAYSIIRIKNPDYVPAKYFVVNNEHKKIVLNPRMKDSDIAL